MKLDDARSIINEVDGKGYTWLKSWGLSTIREAIQTINNRKSSTIEDKQKAEGISWKLSRRY